MFRTFIHDSKKTKTVLTETNTAIADIKVDKFAEAGDLGSSYSPGIRGMFMNPEFNEFPERASSFLILQGWSVRRCFAGSLACLLPNDFARILVFPNSEKDWMPKVIISDPLCEFDLADHRRFNPMTTLHFGSGQPMIPTVAS